MILNYFKTAYRNLLRYKSYSLINLAGLSISMAACLLLFLVIRYEFGYDTFQPDYRSIYHIYTRDDYRDGTEYTPGVPYPALEALRNDLPQLKTGALFCNYGCQVSTAGNTGPQKKFIEDLGVFFCDPGFFDVFSYKWLSGGKQVLAAPNSLVMTKSTAEKYFGSWQNAIGKSVKIDNLLTLQVNGILENMPANTDFPIRMAGSYKTIQKKPVYGYTTDWGSTTSNFQVYALLPEHVKKADIEARLKKLAVKYYKNNGTPRVNLLRPLSDIHFDERLGNMGTHVTSRPALITLSLIGFLIILMACINFINLATAQAVTRSREIGVRKVLGGNRMQLFRQLLGETLFLVIIAALFSLCIASLSGPYIKHIISIEEELDIFTLQSLLFLIATICSVTLLSGVYPTLILSGFKPVTALKNRISSATVGGISLRRGLVVIQFAISQLLIIGTIVAVSQINFIRNADLGFDKEATLLLNGNGDSLSRSKYPAFKEQLLQIPGIRSVSFSSDAPSSDNNSATNFAYNQKPDEKFSLFMKLGDENYFKTFGLRFIAGEAYTDRDSSRKVVVNETLLKKLNIKNAADALGKTLRMGGEKWKTICGVVQDFKTNSLREEIKPIVIVPLPMHYHITAVKLHTAGLPNTLATIQRCWEKFYPDYVYTGSFVDEKIANFYQQENQMALLYKIFAGLAIFISCLGLYGLISFMTVQKTKEVGIRKVLGASISTIVFLFSKEFTLLIGIAFIIAAPLAWYFMNQWLQNFVYRVSIGTGVFIVAILTSVVIAWLTVGYKAIRAARANPVKSLKTE